MALFGTVIIMIFFTSDTHFNHKNIIKYNPNRGASTVEEHNELLIANWNRKVSDSDIVFHLGDFGFGKNRDNIAILSALNGRKFLIPGNHDTAILRNSDFVVGWESILPLIYDLQFKGKFYALSHYPMHEWNGSRHGSIHLHGHTHKVELKSGKNRYNIGIDSNPDTSPWSMTELLEKIANNDDNEC